MLVYKFGGTSVGNPQRMRHVAGLLPRGGLFLVLSATSGTTNRLSSISSSCFARQYDNALDQMQDLQRDMNRYAEELLKEEDSIAKAKAYFRSEFDEMALLANPDFNKDSEKIFLSKGELFSTFLMYLLLSEQNRPVQLIPALDFMCTDTDEQPDFNEIGRRLFSIVPKTEEVVYLTQGYICRDANGKVSNLRRGGSDFTASIIGSVANAEEIVIWTDIDGLHNNDPRYVEGTKPVRVLSFEEADELACFGAKILHPQTVQPARKKGIAVRLKNTMQPEAEGTLISTNPKGDGIKAIAAKDNITVIRINSGRMLMAYGFLRAVFSIFEKYRTPIDMITTSEVAVSLTIDDDRHLHSILPELEKLGNVQVDHNQSILCVVGHNIGATQGIAVSILECLREIPLRMISGGGSQHNLSVLIDSNLKQDALYALQQGLFPDTNSHVSNPLAGTVTA